MQDVITEAMIFKQAHLMHTELPVDVIIMLICCLNQPARTS